VYQSINGYEVVLGLRDRTVDPEKTYNYIKNYFPALNPLECPEIFDEYPQYAQITENEKEVSGNTCAGLRAKIDALNEHEKLLSDGTIIPDYRGTEYWVKADKWVKETIADMGISIPESGILDADLTQEQRVEIAAEQEEDRITKLTPEQREAEKQAHIDTIKREAALKKQEADLFGDDFDIAVWQGKIAELQAKYA
jgi:hypothetical protein